MYYVYNIYTICLIDCRNVQYLCVCAKMFIQALKCIFEKTDSPIMKDKHTHHSYDDIYMLIFYLKPIS